MANENSIDLSIVVPCLNEVETIGTVVRKAQAALQQNRISGEVIVADNGSTDSSVEIATGLGARVASSNAKGYGSALIAGINAARGKFILIGDADDSYDFLEAPKFLEKLREGYELVQGCRMPTGGGQILPGAMPALHRWLGNPVFSMMANWMFHAPIHDVYCGMRAFRKDSYAKLEMRCTGMEFAVEMITKACLNGFKITEVPLVYHPDGRISGKPHLSTLRDGWRTLRFFLLFSPRWLFLYPGIALVIFGVLGYAISLPGLTFHKVNFDVHTMLFASLAILMGYQSILFALFAKTFAISEGFMPEKPELAKFFEIANLERGLALGAAALFAGGILLLAAFVKWWMTSFGALDYRGTMRLVIPGVTLAALGFQTILSSFFASILGLKRK